MRLYPVKPLVTLRTPLGEVPSFWLELVEHRLRRPKGTTCWLWQGACDNDGEPMIVVRDLVNDRRTTKRVKKIIVDHFWPERPPGYWMILHSCKATNCLNAEHFWVTDDHWKSTDISKRIDRTAREIARYGALNK